MSKNAMQSSPRREYVISLDHRKARGAGCERPAEILKAARELFLQQGVENVTTRQIAARVGISQTALYVYFSSKEQMLDALAEDAWRSLAAALAAADPEDAEGSDPVSRLRAILSAYMRFWLRRPDDYRIIFMRKAMRPCPSEDDTRFATRDGLLARLAKRFAEAAKAGLARDSWLPEAAALAMWAAVSGPVALRLAFPDLPWPPEDEHVKATIDMIIQGCDGRGQKGAAKALEPAAEGAGLLK
jgi:AcrR family transcriptional regulator